MYNYKYFYGTTFPARHKDHMFAFKEFNSELAENEKKIKKILRKVS